MKIKSRMYIFMLLAILCPNLTGCGRQAEITQSGFYFDTIISITLYDNSKTEELEHCMELADLYERYFSAQIADSDISRINQAAGTPVKVHDETLALLEKGLYYSKLSQGKFDITIGKLTGLWDFRTDQADVPDQKKIAKAAAAVDYKKVQINGNEVTLADDAAAIDLGGIAKGFIADKMKEYLVSQGVTSGLINLGGNVLVIGTKENGQDAGGAYKIGIQRPFDETGQPIAAVQIKDQTVVTSGVYERYFEKNGRLYHHILDVESGYPYENELFSVSIICPSSADADALSTTCFALGLDQGMELVESLENTEAVFITSDYKLHGSSGIGRTIPFEALPNP
ncbi:MAG: FAD:protein FMN transferase [Eubacterium sp.]|nr:FAD:protein FMN transferase [Eubacterium sp.]